MKWNRLSATAVVLTAALFSVAAAQQSGQQQQQQRQQGTAQNQDVDRQFIQESVRTNLFEVEVGRHVAQNAQDEQVKQFGQTMADYHSKANDNLRQVAQQVGVDVPDEMNEWQQAMVEHMKGLQPGELDRQYMFHQAGTHHIKLLNHHWAMNKGSNQQVKQLAERMVSDLQSHMQRADRIGRQIAGQSGGGNSQGGNQGDSHQGHQHGE